MLGKARRPTGTGNVRWEVVLERMAKELYMVDSSARGLGGDQTAKAALGMGCYCSACAAARRVGLIN